MFRKKIINQINFSAYLSFLIPKIRWLHGSSTLIPVDIEKMGVKVFYNMKMGLKDTDIIMMLRLQLERMAGSYVPSIREYFRFYGLDRDKLNFAKPDALILHPGPMNRGVEIDTELADDIDRSLIREQVEMGVAVRMACLEALVSQQMISTKDHWMKDNL